MIWERIRGKWNHYKTAAKAQWSRLSDEQLAQVDGDREKLAAEIRAVYGMDRPSAERQISAWQGTQVDREPALFGVRPATP